MTLLQPQTLKLYYLIFDSLAISAILRPEVRKVLSPPHCQRKSCCCLHINPVCRFVLASQPQRFVFFHSQMKCGSGIELVSDGGRAMNPLLSPGSILKEPCGSWKTPSFPADEGVFPWGKWEVWGKRFENWGWGVENGDWGMENGGGALGAAFLLVIGWSVSPATGIYELSRHYRREEIIDGILGIIRRGALQWRSVGEYGQRYAWLCRSFWIRKVIQAGADEKIKSLF